jgi:invasion protein IalB
LGARLYFDGSSDAGGAKMKRSLKRSSMQIAISSSALIGVFSAALAQQSPPLPTATPSPSIVSEPQTVTATYGDWTLRCDRVGGQRVCQVSQAIVVASRGTVAQLTFTKPAGKAATTVTALLPPNVSFIANARLVAGANDANLANLIWRKCLPGSCVADAEVSDDPIRQWREQAPAGKLVYVNASEQIVTMGISFKGLAQALDEYAKTTAAP